MHHASPGQPTKYDPEFHNRDFIAKSKEGMTLIMIAGDWMLDRMTLRNWSDAHPEFFATVQKGRDLAEAYWMRVMMRGVWGPVEHNGKKVTIDFRFINWIMANCFGLGKEKQTDVSPEFVQFIEIFKTLANKSPKELEELLQAELSKKESKAIAHEI